MLGLEPGEGRTSPLTAFSGVLPQLQDSQQLPVTDINKIPDLAWPGSDLPITHTQSSIISRPPVLVLDNERSQTALFT